MPHTVLITGCSSGIGRAAAALFAARGWNVAATSRTPGSPGLSGAVLTTRLDVQDQDSIAQAVTETIACFGRLDAVVNNAGYGQYGLFEAIPRAAVQQQFDVNLFGVMDVIRAVLPHFRANRAGTIVNVSSGAGLFTLPMISLYCASKFALEGFSEALSYELASQTIAVKLVEPHGGVGGTRFHDRSAQDYARDPGLSDYNAFAGRTATAFARMAAARMVSAEEVAAAIWEATTDGTDRLRYPVGDDARGFLRARQSLSDTDYLAFMRGCFADGGPV